jgi:tripartite-type tricarboxylate transporter receptor subunit TctC
MMAVLLIGAFAGCKQETGTESEQGSSSQAAGGASEESKEWVPQKDITIVVPYEAGGNTDIPTRIIAKYMSKYSKTSVKVTNITGAGGRTGAKEVMKDDPDGYTLLLQSSGFVMQNALGLADFTYEDFTPIGYFLDSTMALVVSAKSDYKTLDDFVKAAKEDSGKIKMGSVTGTLPLFGALYLEQQNGISFNKVDLGTGAKAPELIGRRIDAYIDGFGQVKQFIDSGDFRCLALFSDTTMTGYEDIPTLSSLGYKDFDYLSQKFGLWAPKGTSDAAVKYINNLIKQISEDKDCEQELEKICYKSMYTTTDEYVSTLKTIYPTFKEAAKSVVK